MKKIMIILFVFLISFSCLFSQFLKFAEWNEYPESVIGYMSGWGYKIDDQFVNSNEEKVLYYYDIDIISLDGSTYNISNLYFVFDEDELLYYGKMVFGYNFKPGKDDDLLEKTVIDMTDLITSVYEGEYEEFDYEVESVYDFYVYWASPTTEILFTPFADSINHGYYGLRIEFQRK